MAELPLFAAVDLAGILRAVAGGQAPDVLAVVLPLHRVGDRVLAVGQRRAAAVEEVVDPALAHVLVLDVPVVDPDMAVLVAEQRPERQVLLAVVNAPVMVVGARPHGPRIRAHGVGRRAERQHVEQHRLVVAHPVMDDETALREPAHRDQRFALLQPGPVHLAVELVGDAPDLPLARIVAVVVRLREEHAHHQQRRVDAGQLHPAVVAMALLHVQEMIVEALVAALAGPLRSLRDVAQEAQGGQGAVHGLGPADPAVLDADRIGRQRIADRGDAGERTRRVAVGRQAVAFVGRVPEELEGALLDVAEQRRQLGPRRPLRQHRLDQHDIGLGRGRLRRRGRRLLAARGQQPDRHRHQYPDLQLPPAHAILPCYPPPGSTCLPRPRPAPDGARAG